MEITNPRFFPGNISGLGMTQEETGRAVDTRYGVHPDSDDGCLIDHPLGEVTIAYAVDGILEGTTDRVRALYLLSPSFTAHIVTHLTALLLRADPAAASALVARLTDAVTPTAQAFPPPEEESQEPVPPAPADTLVMPASEQESARPAA